MNAPMVFSIRPEYIEAFRRGSKQIEYRTRRPSVSVGERVLIYETAPTSAIVAEAVVAHSIIDGVPSDVWKSTWAHGGISREVFDAYFADHTRAVAIWLAMHWLPSPVPLPAGMRAPQSWARLHGSWPIGGDS